MVCAGLSAWTDLASAVARAVSGLWAAAEGVKRTGILTDMADRMPREPARQFGEGQGLQFFPGDYFRHRGWKVASRLAAKCTSIITPKS